MTLQVTELMGSRSLNRDINSDSFTGSRTFLIYDDEGALVSLTDAVNADVGVYFDDQHPDVVGIFASTFTCIASNRCRAFLDQHQCQLIVYTLKMILGLL